MEPALGLLASLVVAAGVGVTLAARERSRTIRRLLLVGLVLHVAGGLAYLAVHESVYGGGDYSVYFAQGTRMADIVVTDGVETGASYLWGQYNERLGTAAVSYLTGWLAVVFGPSMAGLFVLYSVLGFGGVALACAAFRRSFPDADPRAYYTWAMLMPSLWFWTSSLGKDAVVMFGVGLVAYGFSLRRPAWGYALMAAGLATTFLIRPQYALVTVVATLFGLTFGRGGIRSPVLRGSAIVVMAVAVVFSFGFASRALGFDVTDAARVAESVSYRGDATAYGGSAFSAASDPFTGLFNVLFRPFPWEAPGLAVVVASLEGAVFWALAFRRRRAVAQFVRDHWRTKYGFAAAAFVVMLGAGVGMAVGNFGTLVRQRVVVYPFLLVAIAGYPFAPRRIGGRPAPRRRACRRLAASP